MPLTRSDDEVALDELTVAVKSAAAAYEDGADMADDEALADLFRAFARTHRDLSGRLDEVLRAMGALPREPDQDGETFRQVLRHARAALTADQRAELLEERRDEEAAVLECAEAALDAGLEAEARAIVEAVREAARTHRARLAEA